MVNQWMRFWEKIEVSSNGCWLWKSSKFSNGYGAFHLGRNPKRRNALAHRYCYEHLIGPIPEGKDLDHLCRVRHCVNPAHLEPVSRAENLRRGDKPKPVTQCKRGHSFTADNTYKMPNGGRACRACRLEMKRKIREEIKANPKKLSRYRKKDAQRAREYRERQKGAKLGAWNGDKKKCRNGHPYSGENLYVTPGGFRKCRICTRAANNRAYLNRKQRAS